MKRMTAVVATVLSLVLGVSSLLAQSTPTATDGALIRAARKSQDAAMARGDVERAASWWTDDVAIRRGLGAPVNGLAAYKAILERAPVSDTAIVYDRKTTGVTVSDHWPLAFETGTWVARRGAKGAALITGQYSAQWVKRDGKWLIRGEVFVALTCADNGCESKAIP
jgi:ketosteroid isomerase-like protein